MEGRGRAWGSTQQGGMVEGISSGLGHSEERRRLLRAKSTTSLQGDDGKVIEDDGAVSAFQRPIRLAGLAGAPRYRWRA